MAEVRGSGEIPKVPIGAGVFPADDGQNTLPPEGTKKFEKREVKPPSWGDRIITAIKIPVLGIPCVALGTIALILLPLTAIGGYMVVTGLVQESLPKQILGGILAAPFFGAFMLGSEIRQSLKGTDLSAFVEDKEIDEMYLDKAQFQKDISNLEERDLQRLYNKIIKAENITDDQKEMLLGVLAKKIEDLPDIEEGRKEPFFVLRRDAEGPLHLQPALLKQGEDDSFELAVSIANEYIATENPAHRGPFKEAISYLGKANLQVLRDGISEISGSSSQKRALLAMIEEEMKQKRS